MPIIDQHALLRAKAIRCLAVREHSRFELQTKLQAQVADVTLIHLVLDQLQTEGLLSDQRFTEQFVHSRVSQGYGPLRIRSELTTRRVDAALIETALEQAAEQQDWATHLAEVAQRKFAQPAQNKKDQARQARFLARRGFSEAMIRRYLWDAVTKTV